MKAKDVLKKINESIKSQEICETEYYALTSIGRNKGVRTLCHPKSVTFDTLIITSDESERLGGPQEIVKTENGPLDVRYGYRTDGWTPPGQDVIYKKR